MTWVYAFVDGDADGGREDRELLGGKGANLAEMTRIGIPVPPGFTVTTEACLHYLEGGGHPEGMDDEVRDAIARLEEATGKRFGGDDDPLLVSVRSGAAISMPGMMDTILDLGLNDRTVAALAGAAGDERFARDSYRRFVQMYGDVVLGVDAHRYEELLEEKRRARGVEFDHELDSGALRELVVEYKELTEAATGAPFPEDPWDQLWGAIEAVFGSWNTERARNYRKVHGIPDDLGTGVNVQTMVYGNLGDDSASGVAFTRNPATGEDVLYGEYLRNAQGEDVVAGIRDPLPIAEMQERFPDAHAGLLEVSETLEEHYRDMQDFEFTVERRTLYILQTRTGKRTAQAAVRIAVDMLEEGLIDRPTAVLRVDPEQVERLLHPAIDPDADVEPLAAGLPASPGAVSGLAVFTADEAERRAVEEGDPVILVRRETSPDDFHGLAAARGVLTGRGGMTSHAAVVARGMGKPCVAGAKALTVDEDPGELRSGDAVIREGEWITIDGSEGAVYAGRVPTVEPEPDENFHALMEIADDLRALRVRTNADTPDDAARGREFGAEGIGLCRTEHMFFDEARLLAVREMILASDGEARRQALQKLLPLQRDDFRGIFRAMDGLPVTIRLLDPPLHEFLPSGEEEVAALAEELGLEASDVRRSVELHREANPMLGHRGVRLGITYPEITEMQARAIVEAALEAAAEGVEVHPEVMVPLVADPEELRRQAGIVRRVGRRVMEEAGREVPFTVGTMIELPRAALLAAEVAGEAEFFSFGTNDLTQTTFGLSRDDAGTFLPFYVEEGILPADPFESLDVPGVGRLVEIAVREGREARPGLHVGICGEHGGDPDSIAFCHRTGLDYVSCSPFRVPVARLAAAHAALEGAAGAEG